MDAGARGMTRRAPWLVPALGLLMLAAALGSLCLGAVPLAPGRILAVLMGGGDWVARTILIDLRLPRMLLGIGVGAMLGLSGAALQGYLRNPLAEPAVLGVSDAAALGAVCALYFGLSQAFALALPLLAILGALVAVALLFVLAGPAESPLTLILAGVAIAALTGAGISLALNLSPNPFAAMEIMNWLMGSLENRSFSHLLLALPCVLIGGALLLYDARALDALTLGEDGAQALGLNLRAVRLRLMLGVAIGVGGAVAVSGAIGFVGLIVPHLVRPASDGSPSSILWPCALGGAALLTLADVAVRLIPTTSELRLGVLTALLGVPVFLIHLLRERRLW
jgi:iron complex transport system permease protein